MRRIAQITSPAIPQLIPVFACLVPVYLLGLASISFFADVPKQIAIGPKMGPKTNILIIPQTMEAFALLWTFRGATLLPIGTSVVVEVAVVVMILLLFLVFIWSACYCYSLEPFQTELLVLILLCSVCEISLGNFMV